MASLAAVPLKAGAAKCAVLENLIFAFLLSANRLNDDDSPVESARTPEFREEARLELEHSRRSCQDLQGLIVRHCLSHRC